LVDIRRFNKEETDMTIVKTTLIALSIVAAGSVSAFACGGQINASAKQRMPAASTTEASVERAPEVTTVASAERSASDKVVVTE